MRYVLPQPPPTVTISRWASTLSLIHILTTATMNITGATAGMNGYQYRVLGTNSCGTSSPSSGMTLTVNSAPSITTNPSNAAICSGANTTFTVAGSNTPTSYQWQVDNGGGFANISNGGVYSGATTATLSITGATVGMNTYQSVSYTHLDVYKRQLYWWAGSSSTRTSSIRPMGKLPRSWR